VGRAVKDIYVFPLCRNVQRRLSQAGKSQPDTGRINGNEFLFVGLVVEQVICLNPRDAEVGVKITALGIKEFVGGLGRLAKGHGLGIKSQNRRDTSKYDQKYQKQC